MSHRIEYTRRDWIRYAGLVVLLSIVVGVGVWAGQKAQESTRASQAAQRASQAAKQAAGVAKAAADAAKTAADAATFQSVANGDLLAELKGIAQSNAAIAKRIEGLAADAKEAAEAVPKCFEPGGPCPKASADALARIQQKLTDAVAQIDRNTKTTEFIVRRIENGPAGEQQFVAAPICQPAIEVGNVGVLPGAVCVNP
jgi:hypothetical protein